MAPYIHQLLGIPNRGLVFELALWLVVGATGGVVLYREWRSGRSFGQGMLAWLAGGAFVGFGLWRWAVVALTGRLYFGSAGLLVPTYGVAMAAGFAVAIGFGYHAFERSDGPLDGDKAIDLGFWLVVSGLIGARLLFMLTEVPRYVELCRAPESGATADCFAILRFWEGGLVFYGGLIGQLFGSWIWCRRNDVDFLHMADAAAPWGALGHFFGRLGCLAAGCCFGAERGQGWGLVYPAGSPAWEAQLAARTGPAREALVTSSASLPTYPVPLVEALVELAACLVLVLWLRPRKRFDGQLILAWIAIYAPARFILELYRGDGARGFVFEWRLEALNRALALPADTITLLSTSQTVSVLALLGAAVAWVVLRRRAPV